MKRDRAFVANRSIAKRAWILCYRTALAMAAICLSFFFQACDGTEGDIVGVGVTWKYLDNGSDQGTAWRGVTFDDSTWRSGKGKFGYGKGGLATQVWFGPDPNKKHITTYFRAKFNIPDAAMVKTLTLNLLRDDGAIVYLNGNMVCSNNMPGGEVNYLTQALWELSGSAETKLHKASIPVSSLVDGENILAVEVHQAAANTPDMLFNLRLSASVHGQSPDLVTRLYLQSGSPTSVVVRWQTFGESNSIVRYGPSPGDLNQHLEVGTRTTEHEVKLTGLTPNTKYYYSVERSGKKLQGGDDKHFFITSPETGTAKPTRIWVLGDSGTANREAEAVREAYYKYTGDKHTDLWLMLGDNAYDDGKQEEYQEAVFKMYPDMLKKSVLWPTLGNHETKQRHTVDVRKVPYFDIFTLPTEAEAGGIRSGTENYYSFDYGNIHFICLDSMVSQRKPEANGEPSTMMKWLRSDLESTTQQWIIAFWHHPPYTKGSHDSDNPTFIVKGKDFELVEMRKYALPILEEFGVDLILSGHSHSYERSFLIHGHYGFSQEISNNRSLIKDSGHGRNENNGAYRKIIIDNDEDDDGAVYTVAGSSGKISGGSLNHPAMRVSENKLGSVILDVKGNTLDAKFLSPVANSWRIVDHFTLIKEAISEAIMRPSNTRATPVSNRQIDITWEDKSNAEEGFIIERSDEGHTFEEVGRVSPDITSYSDDKVQPNRTYYYRVRAFNAKGSSADINVVRVRTQP